MPVLETVLQQISTKTVFSERKLKETGLANLENPDKHVTCAHVTTSSCPMVHDLEGASWLLARVSVIRIKLSNV